ncbi:MAG TPA: acyl-CoA thioesterase II [Nevskiaceae bacterium]|nr:acyl-CoA thioesterase II [Nevskiaceae bacterium]
MNDRLQDLVRLLDLETLEQNLFRGQSRNLGGRSVFGGQVLGQSLIAAGRTVPHVPPHSLHGYFLRPGDMETPIVYEVDRVRDGQHFSTRRVQAIQFGRPIFTAIASFQPPEPGLEHQMPMPDVPPPEELRSQTDLRDEWLDKYGDKIPERLKIAIRRPLPIEFRQIDPWNPLAPDKRPAHQSIWLRAAHQLPDDPTLHRCVLAYASDFNLLPTALLPHGKSFLDPKMAVASIDHAIWFHRDAHADDWILYVMDSPTAQSARGLSRGMMYDRSGRLVASVVQESLMREHRLPKTRD